MLSYEIYQDDKIKEGDMGGRCNVNGQDAKYTQDLYLGWLKERNNSEDLGVDKIILKS